jgi:hypothetical protein
LHMIAWDNFKSPAKDVIRMNWETDWEPSLADLEGTIMRYRGRFVVLSTIRKSIDGRRGTKVITGQHMSPGLI